LIGIDQHKLGLPFDSAFRENLAGTGFGTGTIVLKRNSFPFGLRSHPVREPDCRECAAQLLAKDTHRKGVNTIIKICQ
jgi:hypothetical protein